MKNTHLPSLQIFFEQLVFYQGGPLLCSARTLPERYLSMEKHWGEVALKSLQCLSDCFVHGHFQTLDQIQLCKRKEEDT